MHKIDVSSYPIRVKLPTGEMESVQYGVKEMLVGVLLHPSLQIAGAELYKRMPIADKIKKADDTLLLEDDEYAKLLDAVNRIQGFGMNDAELVKRVIDAEKVAVAEANKEAGK